MKIKLVGGPCDGESADLVPWVKTLERPNEHGVAMYARTIWLKRTGPGTFKRVEQFEYTGTVKWSTR